MTIDYKTFSFVSGKGGVGKTLIAINMACELSAYSNVLLIDFDLFNYGLTLHFKNIIENFNTPQHSVLTLYDLIEHFDPPTSQGSTADNTVRVKMVTDIIRDRSRKFCTIDQDGVAGKIHFLPCFVPFSAIQVDSNAEILRDGGHWSKVVSFVDLLNNIIPTLVKETDSQFVLFDCHPGLVAFSVACCAVSDCNILISDFDDSTILSSIIFNAFVNKQIELWQPSKVPAWRIVINRVPSPNDFCELRSKLDAALNIALETVAVKALGVGVWESIGTNLRNRDPLAKIPDLEELRDQRIQGETLSPARRGGNGLILSVKLMIRNMAVRDINYLGSTTENIPFCQVTSSELTQAFVDLEKIYFIDRGIGRSGITLKMLGFSVLDMVVVTVYLVSSRMEWDLVKVASGTFLIILGSMWIPDS